ncbi:hypothetical protein CYMTET_24762 [Cymbomonas tetramitiformis]|uniref:Response regulatory domain-containing protein n=1 Tax=Cymbomonas tetramitiformis TaxID=36881 RepID=A0AAE0FVL8_9CHLO|nr:hypothetical protein CYMTET_24762 [Cymbomonas tetramitiformis]
MDQAVATNAKQIKLEESDAAMLDSDDVVPEVLSQCESLVFQGTLRASPINAADKGRDREEVWERTELQILDNGLVFVSEGQNIAFEYFKMRSTWTQDNTFCIKMKAADMPHFHFACGEEGAADKIKELTRQKVEKRLEMLAEAVAQTPRSQLEAKPEEKCVLVIDMPCTARRKLVEVLKKSRQNCCTVRAYDEALAKYDAEPERFTSIMMELFLDNDAPGPTLSAFQLVRAIRHRERGAERSRVPIFAISKKNFDDTVEDMGTDTVQVSSCLCHCEEAGFDGYMMKPVSSRKMRSLLAQYVAASSIAKGAYFSRMGPGLDHSEGGEHDSFDANLAEFYAKEDRFARLVFLPALITRAIMKRFYWLCTLIGFRISPAQRDRIYIF